MYESALFPFFGFSGFRCSALVSSRFPSSSGSRYLRLHTATAPLCTTVFLHLEHAKNYIRNSLLLHSLHGTPWLIFTLVALFKNPRAYATNTRFTRTPLRHRHTCVFALACHTVCHGHQHTSFHTRVRLPRKTQATQLLQGFFFSFWFRGGVQEFHRYCWMVKFLAESLDHIHVLLKFTLLSATLDMNNANTPIRKTCPWQRKTQLSQRTLKIGVKHLSPPPARLVQCAQLSSMHKEKRMRMRQRARNSNWDRCVRSKPERTGPTKRKLAVHRCVTCAQNIHTTLYHTCNAHTLHAHTRTCTWPHWNSIRIAFDLISCWRRNSITH